MSELRSIEIDFDVHKMIELERMSFSETPNEVLRRLLKMDGPSPAIVSSTPEGRPWTGKGVTLPHGTKLRMEYTGRQYTGQISDSEWVVEGQRFKTPSAAASGVAVTRNGNHTQLDGWRYWYVKRPDDADWIAILRLRPRDV